LHTDRLLARGDHLYWHGSSASRMLRSQKAGLPVCAARFPVRTVIGELEVCPRMPKDVPRPEGLAGFVAGRSLDAIMTENYAMAYRTAVLSSTGR
jgi:hypothetical protein